MPLLISNIAQHRIAENKKVFDKAAQKAQDALQKDNLNTAIAWTKIAAHFASIRHPGFYVSPELENLLLDVANRIKQEPPEFSGEFYLQNKLKNAGKMRFLHITTEIYGTGGHSCYLDRWIQNTFDTSVHSLISTAQTDEVSPSLKNTLDTSGGWYLSLPELSSDLAEQALLLRLLGQNWADVIVLFAHPFDPLPTVAFGVQDGPPVALINHADHAFWLGASVADVVVDYHASGGDLCAKRRGTAESKILPIPMSQADTIVRMDARKELGFRKDEVIILTVGREEKYYPFGELDYLDVMVDFLKKHDAMRLIAAGPTYTLKWQRAHEESNGRIEALGQIDRSQLEKYYCAADVYIPSFPCSSGTALLEAAMHNLPIVGLHLDELPHLSLRDDVGFRQLKVHKLSVEEFVAALESTLNYPQLTKRKAQLVKENVEREHCMPGWNRYLTAILQALPSQHRIRRLKPQRQNPEAVDAQWEAVSAKMLGDELPWHSYSRLIRTYQRHLSKTEALNSQATSLMSAFVKSNNFKRGRQFLRSFGEFVDSAF